MCITKSHEFYYDEELIFIYDKETRAFTLKWIPHGELE